jgi:hypothetical protein
MSSVLRGPAQISDRSKYLIGIMDTSGSYPSPPYPVYPPIIPNTVPLNGNYTYAFETPAGTFGPSDQVVNAPLVSFNPNAQYYAIRSGMLFKDLGRQLYVYTNLGTGASLLCIYRQCARMASANTEGINPAFFGPGSLRSNNTIWVKVWSSFTGFNAPAFANGPAVARLG